MVRRGLISFLIVVSALVLVSGQLYGQSATAVPKMPKDASDILMVAGRVNGLSAFASIKAWHLEANYQTFDANGKPEDQGTFEELWDGPKHYKISYEGKRFSQTIYQNGDSRLITGDEGWTPLPQLMVAQYLVHPIDVIGKLPKSMYNVQTLKLGKAKLKCVSNVLEQEMGNRHTNFYCFSLHRPALRMISNGGYLFIVFNGIASMDGSFYAREIAVENAGVPIVNVNVVSFEALPKVDMASVVAPKSAVPPPGLTVLPSGIIAFPRGLIRFKGKRSKAGGRSFSYPPLARKQRIQGLVLLDVVTKTNGEVSKVKVVSGPDLLQQGASDSVKTWKYDPILVKGQPVAVQREVSVVFSLDRP